jgi:hypothetical protein
MAGAAARGLASQYPGPYRSLEPETNTNNYIRPTAGFYPAQKNRIYALNRTIHSLAAGDRMPVVSDDPADHGAIFEFREAGTGQATSGQLASPEVDHINPAESRGSNSYCNARVVRRRSNRPGAPSGEPMSDQEWNEFVRRWREIRQATGGSNDEVDRAMGMERNVSGATIYRWRRNRETQLGRTWNQIISEA